MKKNGILLFTISVVTLISNNAFGFIDSNTGSLILNSINSQYQDTTLDFNEVRCSRRQNSCFVKIQKDGYQSVCEIEHIYSSFDLIETSNTDIKLTPEANNILKSCVSKIL